MICWAQAMTNVITFPNAASSADVICTPLSITFPRIYRAALRGVMTRTVPGDTRPLSTKDSYGRFDGDAATRASAHLTAGSSAEHLQ